MSNMLMLSHSITEALKRACKDRNFPADKLLGVSSDFGLTPDQMNNLLYGRVDLSDSFVILVYARLRQYCPDVARDLLRDFFRDPSIMFTPAEPLSQLNEDDLHKIILRAAAALGDLAGAHADNLADAQLDVFEVADELTHTRRLQALMTAYEAHLLRRQADLVASSQGRRRPNAKKGEPNGR